jgi:hypothetical protein
MQDTHADSPGNELFEGTKVVDEGTTEIRGELRHLFRAHLPEFRPVGQRLTKPSQPVDIELFRLKGFAAIHDQRVRIGRSDQLPPRRGGGDDHIPGLELPEEQRGIRMERVAREEMKIEYGEGHRGLLLRIRKDLPHPAFDDRRDNTVQAPITIEQLPQGRPVLTIELDQHGRFC